MAMDITLFKLDGNIKINDSIATKYAVQAEADAPTTHERLRIICSKVLKYLLTYKGSDAFDPEYGGTALQSRNISDVLLPEIRMNLLQDIADCTSYLKNAEQEKVSSLMERLDRITLVSLDYDRVTNATKLRARIRITTTYGNNAVIEV